MSITEATTIGGVKFADRLMNGAFIGSKTLQDVNDLLMSPCGSVVVGSISVEPRVRNPGQGYWLHREKFYSLNSFGLPNGGIPYFKENLPRMVEAAHKQNKLLIANVVGFSKEEFLTLIKLAQVSGADMAELNFGCPNVWDKGAQKQIISYHPSLVKEILNYIAKNDPKIKLAVKISPLPPDILREVTQEIVASKIVQVVTATNSYPNASLSTGTTDSSKDATTILAGLAGRSLKPISLGVVKQLRELLPETIDIIGCGGISSANDVEDYLSAGAKAVQIASALVDDGPSVFQKIIFQSTSHRFN